MLLASTASAAEGNAFRAQEIANQLGVVYAVTTADVNADGKPDVVAISGTQLLWFENPSWTRHVVTERVTQQDNVAIAPFDIDGDGRLDFALAADWQATNTKGGGSLHWVSHDGTVRNIGTEPTLHRIRWADIDGKGRAELIAVPLHGRGTAAPDWTAGPGARILVYAVPKDPVREPWPYEIASDRFHIVHNFLPVGRELWLASAEGVHALKRESSGKWSVRKIGEGKPGEIKMGRIRGKRYLATVEPWHGESVVVYSEARGLWPRTTIASDSKQAHALGWGDFDGDGNDELAVGWRGKPWGLAVYRMGGDGKWTDKPVDDGVAVEDLTVADLNSDGKPEIIAGGRATSNIRIYWNEPVR